VKSALILRCDASDRFVASDLFRQKKQVFQGHPSRLEETEYKVEIAADSRVLRNPFRRSKGGDLK
jgi:hypothetical protein